MNKLRINFKSCPREVFTTVLADLTVEFPVVSFSLNGTAVDNNIDLAYSGQGTDRNLITKEYDVDLNKNFDKLTFTLSKRQINYDQVFGLGYQSPTEDCFLSDAEVSHITNYSNMDFCTAEIMSLEYSEDGGTTWNTWKWEGCYAYLVDGGLFNGKDLANLSTLPLPNGSTRQKLTVPEMMAVSSQLLLPYSSEGMPVLDRQDLGFDSFIIFNFDGQQDVSSVISAQDAQIDPVTCISVYNPI